MSRLPRATPESQGVPSTALLQLVSRWERQEMRAFRVVRHGYVIAEGAWAPYQDADAHQLFSLSKSFCSTAAGFAVAEGRLRLDDRVVDHMAEFAPANPTENLRQMRVRDLLAMATGQETESWGEGDLRRRFLATPVPKAPGTHFLYNTPATYMVSAIVQKVTGQTLTQYLEPRLYQPLGFGSTVWEQDGQGIDWGGFGLSLTVEDVAKFGELLRLDGVWQGRRILPETWVGQASAKQVSNGNGGPNDWAQGYGFQYWRCRHGAFRGDGAFGQLCVVMSTQGLVVAATAAVDDIQEELNAIYEALLPALSPRPIKSRRGRAELAKKLQSLQLPRLPVPKGGTISSALAGRYRVEGAEFRELSIVVSDQGVHVECSGEPPASIPAMIGTWSEGNVGAQRVFACGAPGHGVFQVRMRWRTQTQGEDWGLSVEGERLKVTRKVRGVLWRSLPGDFSGVRVG
jgi:CubicO group peptidase (beta-lactamase class C family)